MEARLYAEDPRRDFLPATGRLAHLAFPPESPNLRVDSGVESGDAIGIHYDPMIAKIVVWDRDRGAAARRLAAALAATEVVGLTSNLAFLAAIARHPAFVAAELDTGFIARHQAVLLQPPQPLGEAALACACLAEVLRGEVLARERAATSGDPTSPWNDARGWRMNAETQRHLIFLDGETSCEAVVHYRPVGFEIEIAGRRRAVSGTLQADGRLVAELDGRRLRGTAIWLGQDLDLLLPEVAHRLTLFDPLARAEVEEAGLGSLTAPMPGKVVQVLAEAGSSVERGAPLVVLEAMKMEHTLAAPAPGRVAAIHYAVGDTVEEGAEIIDFEALGS